MENHIPILTALNDLYFMTKDHPLPRMLIKPFNEGLKSVYREFYGKELRILTFGKPEKNTYDFSKAHLRAKYGNVRKVVMVGDNESTDILGAHHAGWESILVKSGVTKHDSEIATHNCDTLKEGFAKYGVGL